MELKPKEVSVHAVNNWRSMNIDHLSCSPDSALWRHTGDTGNERVISSRAGNADPTVQYSTLQ